ncbi:MAG: hypothetical protein HF967_03755, partial [Methanosarcinales archaeon]|nr:hypothetical protein [Methanosarcinales archaeon]
MKYKYMPINRKIMSVCMSLMILLTTLTPITSIIIAPQEVTRIEITPDKVILNITEQIDFDINAYPKGVYLSNVTWGVSNSEIGFIDSNGVFTASDVGNTTIIATNGNMTATAYISIKHKTQTFFEDNVTTQLAEDNVAQSIDSNITYLNIKQNNPITAQTLSQYVFSINETKEISIGENTTFNITLNTPFDRQGIHLINVKFRIELTNNLVGEIIYYTPPEQGSTLTIPPYMPIDEIEVIISHLSGLGPAINLGAIKVRGDATGNTKINISGIEVKLWHPIRDTITNFENQNGTLEVMLLPLEKIEITPQNTSILSSSKPIQFTASPTPFGHPLEYLIWEVSNNSIGTIDVNGLFTPILPGIVNIIARHGNITANTTLTVLPSLRDGVDNIELTWNTDGWENWFLQNTIAFYEGDAIESGEISHRHYSWVETTVEGPGNLSFYWNVSSEFEKDFLIFKINGIEQDRISGTNHTWTQKSYELDSGINELRWKFIKDASVSRGTDSGWLDKVVFEPIFSKINISPDITEIIIGQNRDFDAILSPESIDQTVIWGIDNESIGIIDSQTGVFTARAIGTANITATSVIDNNYSENAIIRVVANPHSINITPS